MKTNPSADVRFRTIYDDNFEAMRSYCVRRVPVSDVNDVLSDLFLVVWRKIDQVPQGDEARRWLYGVARRVVSNSERSRRRGSRLFFKAVGRRGFDAPDPEALVLESDLAGEVMAAMQRLRPADQEILRLRVWEELASADIGAVVGMSAAAVDTRLSRIRKSLRRSLDTPQLTSTDRPPLAQGGEQ